MPSRNANRPAGGYGRAAYSKQLTKVQLHDSTERNSGAIPVRRADGRVVGQIVGDVLRKRASRAHMLHSPPGWAWDASILDAAEQAGARFTEIECEGTLYRASLAAYRRHGFTVSRGHGEQVALELAYWDVGEQGRPAPAAQLSLFGGDR